MRRRLYSPSLTDLREPLNVDQARHELDQAVGDRDRLAEWADKWGNAAIGALGGSPHRQAPARGPRNSSTETSR